MISVIMAVYNAEKYLKEAIESILNQTYEDLEFIIVDDCSIDNSREILKKYSEKDERIKLINNKKNLGLTKSLNNALKVSKGKYIARMDADDISELNRFEEQINFLKNNIDVDIVGTFSNDINEDGKITGERKNPVTHDEILSLLPKINPIAHPTVMMRKKSIEKINGYNEEFRKCQDYELWFRAISNGLKCYNIPKFLFKYRMNDNYTSRKSWGYRKIDIKIRLEGYKQINLPFYKYIYIFIPIVLGIVPSKLFFLLKKLDPR